MGRKRTVHPMHRLLILAALALAVLVGAGCTADEPEVAQVPPTKTPKPTFTLTPEWTPTPIVFATTTPAIRPTPEATATPAPTEVPPSPTPEPAPASQPIKRSTSAAAPERAIRGWNPGGGDSYEILARTRPATGLNSSMMGTRPGSRPTW